MMTCRPARDAREMGFFLGFGAPVDLPFAGPFKLFPPTTILTASFSQIGLSRTNTSETRIAQMDHAEYKQ